MSSLSSLFALYNVLATMDDILQAQFDRVEQALGTLVDSIASYNPNPQAAIDLVAADEQLSHGLDQRKLTSPYSTTGT